MTDTRFLGFLGLAHVRSGTARNALIISVGKWWGVDSRSVGSAKLALIRVFLGQDGGHLVMRYRSLEPGLDELIAHPGQDLLARAHPKRSGQNASAIAQ